MNAHARTTDPGTSHEAAESVSFKITKTRRQVLDCLNSVHSGLTDEELGFSLGDRIHSTYRSRRNELTQMGLVRDSGKKRTTISGRNAIVWVA